MLGANATAGPQYCWKNYLILTHPFAIFAFLFVDYFAEIDCQNLVDYMAQKKLHFVFATHLRLTGVF